MTKRICHFVNQVKVYSNILWYVLQAKSKLTRARSIEKYSVERCKIGVDSEKVPESEMLRAVYKYCTYCVLHES